MGDGVFLGVGMLRDAAPWSAQANLSHPTTVFSDTVDFYAPQQDLLAEGARHLHLPLWNPYVSGGVPLGAIPDTGALSPFAVVRALLPDRLAPAWSALFSLAGAVGFTYLFLRRLGLRVAAAWLGGAVYATSGFIVSWTNWPHARIAALFPALFWAVDRVMAPDTPSASFDPDNRGQTTHLAVRGAGRDRRRGHVVRGFPLGHRLLPVRHRGVRAVRRRSQPRSRLAKGDGRGGRRAPRHCRCRRAARAVRAATEQPRHLLSRSEHERAPAVCRARLLRDAVRVREPRGRQLLRPKNLVETQSFLGGAAIVLVLVAIAARPPVALRRGARGFWIGVSAVCVALVYGGGLPLALAVHLPVFSNNFVGRLRSLLLLALAVLAAIGFERVLEGARARTEADARFRWRRVAGAAVAVVIGAVILWALAHAAAPHAARRRRNGRISCGTPWCRAWPSQRPQCSWCSRCARRRRGAYSASYSRCRASSRSRRSRSWSPGGRESLSADYYPATPTTQFLAAHLDGNRYAADNDTLFPSANAAYKLRAVSGHAFKEPAWRDLVASIDPTQPQGSTVLTMSDADKTATSPILDRLAARYFVAQPGVPVYGARTPPPASRSTFTLTDGESTTFSDHGPLRAVVVRAPQGFARGGAPAYLDATVRDASGKILAQGRRPLLELPPIDIDVAVPGDALGSGAHTVTLRLDAPGRTLTLAGTSAAPAHGTVRPPAVDDGLRVRFADDTVIYERTTRSLGCTGRVTRLSSAAPRIGSARSTGDTTPMQCCSMARAPRRRATRHTSPSRTTTVTRSRVAVDAHGAGYLVVADALQQGWKATVDGRPAALRPADGAVVAIAVGTGDHVVHLWYDPDGREPALRVVDRGGARVRRAGCDDGVAPPPATHGAGEQMSSDVPIGNHYDKYASKNPIARRMMDGFMHALDGTLPSETPVTVFELGMGEGEIADRIRNRYGAVQFTGLDLPDAGLAPRLARAQPCRRVRRCGVTTDSRSLRRSGARGRGARASARSSRRAA